MLAMSAVNINGNMNASSGMLVLFKFSYLLFFCVNVDQVDIVHRGCQHRKAIA